MALLDFPAAPIVNQLYAAPNGATYRYDGAAWVVDSFTGSIAGGDLTGTYPNPTVAANAVGNAEISDVAWGKVTGAPAAFPPNGAATGDLTGTYPAPTIAANAVGNAEISDVGWAKVTGAPTTYPPSGAAGGSLSGTYPNPAIAAGGITLAMHAVGSSIRAGGGSVNMTETQATGATPVIFASVPVTTVGGSVFIHGALIGSLHDTSGAGAKWAECQLLFDTVVQRRWIVPVLHPTTMVVGHAFPIYWNHVPAAGAHTYAVQVVTDPAVVFRADLFAGVNRAGTLTVFELA